MKGLLLAACFFGPWYEPPGQCCIYVDPTQRHSQVLMSEWKRIGWSLERIPLTIQAEYRVEFVDVRDTDLRRSQVPSVRFSYFDPIPLHCSSASGEALLELDRVYRAWRQEAILPEYWKYSPADAADWQTHLQRAPNWLLDNVPSTEDFRDAQ